MPNKGVFGNIRCVQCGLPLSPTRVGTCPRCGTPIRSNQAAGPLVLSPPSVLNIGPEPYVPPTEPELSVKVFICYAHADQELHRKLEEHLSSLKYSGKITIWQDQEIPAGANWENQISTHLNEANMILLLVSASFIASKYCWNKEVQTALLRHKAGAARVIPIILRPALWQNTPLGELQALPTGVKPVTQWSDQDAAFEDIVLSLRDVVEELLIPLREEAQKKEKINALISEKARVENNLRNTKREMSVIDDKISQSEKRKKELESELDLIKASIEELRNQRGVYSFDSFAAELRLGEIIKQLEVLGAWPPPPPLADTFVL